MPQFIATAPKGLVEALAEELRNLDLNVVEIRAGGVVFESNWEGCYKANLQSRLASRILKPVLDFTAYQPEELYEQIMHHDFTKYIRPDQTLTIDVNVKECMLRDQRFVAMKIKDAVVDQFTEKFGVRPDVDNNNPALRIHVKGYKNSFNVSIDTSGDSLFARGYRKEVVDAPVKENLAAGLIVLSGWDKKSPLVDFMCGSGTFLIEGAMMAMNIAPGIQRKRFAFMNLLGFDRDVWGKLVDEAVAQEVEDLDFKFYGYDIDKKAIAMTQVNAKSAGVDHVIELSRQPVAMVEPPVEKGLIVMNPPYGIRIGDEDNVRDVYRDISFTLKHKFKGWDAWILSGNKDLIADLKLKSTRKHFVFNGNIECRFLKYSMF